jgi:hypothetical protein
MDAITRHLDLGSYLSWSEEQRTAWLMEGEGVQQQYSSSQKAHSSSNISRSSYQTHASFV